MVAERRGGLKGESGAAAIGNKDEKQISSGQENESDAFTLNIDAILQIGSVMERVGIEQKRQESFDWLAQNREKVKSDRKEVAKHLQIAIGDLPISRDLIKKESFDWLAQNREKVKSDRKEVAKHLQIAIGDLPISRDLIKKCLEELIKRGKLSTEQYEKEFKMFEAAPEEQLPTIAQMSALLREFGGYIKRKPSL
ncbi:hypothetical protein Tcan_18492 [Toxocara canis]|uniref:Uncharacterized protein n=1 Tax=Toxocara canis TaxID=6265 RepID=A0A0B2W3D1_TOXCA|nr:hypothetical protein Tcan_18492 [Toxocara canis]